MNSSLQILDSIDNNEVLYVKHNNQKMTFEDYVKCIKNHKFDNNTKTFDEVVNDEYNQCYIEIIDLLYNDLIVSDQWWYEYTNVCCQDPQWVYHQHPDY